MKVIKPRDRNDLIKCVDLYLALNDETFLPSNRIVCLQKVETAYKTGKYFKILIDDLGEIIGWLHADTLQLSYMSIPILQQMFYMSNQTGVKAVRAVELLHEDLIFHGEEIGVKIITSMGSYMDPNFVFVRILEKSGWERRGYMAIYKTRHYYK